MDFIDSRFVVRISLLLLALAASVPKTSVAQNSEALDTIPVVIRTTLMPGIPDVSHIPPGLAVKEPSIVADPQNPERVAVGGRVEHRTGGSSHPAHGWTRVWYSTDGARTWSEGQDLLPDFSGLSYLEDDGEKTISTGDPTMTVLPDGRFSVAVNVSEWHDPTNVTRSNTGTGPYEGLFVATQPAPGSRFSEGTRVGLSDLPEPSYAFPHVPTLFANRSPESPRRGNLYLTYLAPMGTAGDVEFALFLKVSEDGGQSFGQAREVPRSRGFFPNNDGVVGPDGLMHLLVTRDSTDAVHLLSEDGGRTFATSDAASIPPGASNRFPHLAIGRAGPNRGVEFAAIEQEVVEGRNAVYDVLVFPIPGPEAPAAPRRLDPDLSSEEQIRLPSVAVTEDALWTMVYRQGPDGTEIVLYRSTDHARTWREARVIASRNTTDFSAGHYSSLVAVGNRLYAAYSLPTGDPARPVGAYTGVIDVR